MVNISVTILKVKDPFLTQFDWYILLSEILKIIGNMDTN